MAKNKFSEFLTQMRVGKSVNLPSIAEQVGLDFFVDVMPKIETDVEFKRSIQQELDRIKFALYQEALEVGMNGKRNTRNPELSYINFIIKQIDSGNIVGRMKDGENAIENPAVIEEHLNRLGIKESND